MNVDQRYEPQQQPMPMAPETPLAATLTANEWNLVLFALRKLPMEAVEEQVIRLRRQLFHEANQRAQLSGQFSTEEQQP